MSNDGNNTAVSEAESISTKILIVLFLLLLSITGGQWLRRLKITFIQESTLSTIIGISFGYVLYFFEGPTMFAKMRSLQGNFVDMFMIILLPFIIFQAGFNLEKKGFYKHIGSIMLIAFLGTFVASVFTTLFVWISGYLSICTRLTFKESFAFGALVSSTDPVAVLSIFKEISVDSTLYNLIFGESVLNDVVSMILYKTIVSSDYSESMPLNPVLDFFGSLLGSLAIGVCTALIIAYFLKKNYKFGTKQKNVEIVFMGLCPWVTYLLAENFGLSGIVSIFFNGVVLSHYASPNLTPSSAELLKSAYETISYASETLVFIFLGLGLFAFNHPYKEMGSMLLLVSSLGVALGRFLNVYGISTLINRISKGQIISQKYMFVMWISGLRGAMAYALALCCYHDMTPGNGDIILLITLLISLATIIVVATGLKPVLSICKLEQADPIEMPMWSKKHQSLCKKIKEKIRRFHKNVMTPIFLRENRKDPKLPRDDYTPLLSEDSKINTYRTHS